MVYVPVADSVEVRTFNIAPSPLPRLLSIVSVLGCAWSLASLAAGDQSMVAVTRGFVRTLLFPLILWQKNVVVLLCTSRLELSFALAICVRGGRFFS